MTGRLALDLSAERITLLGADASGWFRLADVRFGSAQFADGVERLLRVARNVQGVLVPGAASDAPPVLLVLPEAQVTWDAPADPAAILARPDPRQRRDLRQTAEGLRLASVPLDTLHEAESFVRGLGFAPVGSIAPGPAGSGFETAWFGALDDPTEHGLAASRPSGPAAAFDRRRVAAHPPAALAAAVAEETAARRRAREAARIDPANLRPLDDAADAAPAAAQFRAWLPWRRRAASATAPARPRRGIGIAGLSLALAASVGAAVYLGGPPDDVGGTPGAEILGPVAGPGVSDAPPMTPPETGLAERSGAASPERPRTLTPAPQERADALPAAGAGEPDGQPGVRRDDLPAGPVVGFYTPAPGLGRPAADRALPADILEQPGLDPELGADALALPAASLPGAGDRPAPLAAPPEASTRFVVDDRGLVVPTAQGARTPAGHLVIAGRPAKLPARRAEAPPPPEEADLPPPPVTERAALDADDPLRLLSPRQRPDGLAERFERSQLGGRTLQELAGVRPPQRPESLQEQQTAAAAPAPPTANAIDVGPRPPRRPPDFAARAVAGAEAAATAQAAARAAVAAASTAAVSAPRAAAPSRTVATRQAPPEPAPPAARAANEPGRINLSEINLLGTFGKGNALRALVRMPDGDIVNVSVGDRIDGGKVQTIGSGQLVYVKRGRPVTLAMPQG